MKGPHTKKTKEKLSLLFKGKHRSSPTEFKKGSNLGEKNHLWKGKKASYTAFHHWLRYHHGKAIKCENKSCYYPRKMRKQNRITLVVKPSMFQWALLKGKEHEQKRENYIQLCPSCHTKYDRGNLTL